ncbi:MAG: hypothetical protein H7339_15070 [Arcicella sp.]|nr:hypothetical protein [Arcicella sp.]
MFTKDNKKVVVKFEKGKAGFNDYIIAQTLFNAKIPNFIKYYCYFNCKEDPIVFDNLPKINVPGEHHLNFCTGPGDEMGFIVMPFYRLGSVKNYTWTRQNFDQLKTVLKQVFLSLVTAFLESGFIHKDPHLDNILIRKTKKQNLSYRDIHLKLSGYYAIIVDFGRAEMNGNSKDFFTSIQIIFSLLRDIGDKTTVIIDSLILVTYIHKLKSDKNEISTKICEKILCLIDKISIEYDKQTIL